MSLIDEDEALIMAALKGSVFAWEKLVKRYESKIYNHGLRLTGNPSDAMDLMQEVFLGVYRNLHRFRGDAKFSSWIFRIAHNKAVDMNRRKKLMTSSPKFFADDGDDEFEKFPGKKELEPENRLGNQEQNVHVLKMLSELSSDQRSIVELKVFQSLTFDEIAELQDISANTVKTRFYSALKKMKVVSEEQNVLS